MYTIDVLEQKIKIQDIEILILEEMVKPDYSIWTINALYEKLNKLKHEYYIMQGLNPADYY